MSIFVGNAQQPQIQTSLIINKKKEQKMFNNQPQLTQTLTYLSQILQQNNEDKTSLHLNLPSQRVQKMLQNKIQMLEYITQIAISALHCVEDLKQERDCIEDQCSGLRRDIEKLCRINCELQGRVEDLIVEIGRQGEQIEAGEAHQRLLEIQRSFFRRELQSNQAILEKIQNQQKENINIQPQNIKQFSDSEVKSNQMTNIFSNKQSQDYILQPTKMQTYDEQNNGVSKSFHQQNNQKDRKKYKKMISFQKQFECLRQATNILKRKVSQQQKRQKKSLKSLNSLTALSCHFPRIKLKHNESQKSDKKISIVMGGLEDSTKFMSGGNLAEQLGELNITSCNSIIEVTPTKQKSNIQQIEQPDETNQSICQQYDYNSRSIKNNWKKSPILQQYNPENLKSKILKKPSIKNKKELQTKKIKKEQKQLNKCLCTTIKDKFIWFNDICFDYIVKNRIQPRRTILRQRERARKNQK